MKLFSTLLHFCLWHSNYAQVQLPRSKNAFVVIAHRGDHTAAPENTIKAFRNAIKNHADYIEIDLRTTKDSQLVIMHDENLFRMTGINESISNLTLDSLKKIYIFDKNHPEYGRHHIPTLAEILKLCKGRANIYLDFKNASVQKTYETIYSLKMDHSVIVYINSPSQFKLWRIIAPSMPLMISLPSHIKDKEALKLFIETHHPDLLDGNYESYSASMVEAAAESNIKIWPDIQSTQEEKNWGKAIRMNFSGLQTDHPLALIRFLKRNKLR